MIVYKELLPSLRHVINESDCETGSFTKETDTALLDFIRMAAKQLIITADLTLPHTLSGENVKATWKLRPDGLHIAVIPMPDNYLKMVSLYIDSWRYPVTELLPVNDSFYWSQYTSAPGIANGPARPVAFQSEDPTKCIIAHATRESDKLIELKYKITPGKNDAEIDARYSEALIYLAAWLYLQSIENFDGANAAHETAASFINIVNNKIQPS